MNKIIGFVLRRIAAALVFGSLGFALAAVIVSNKVPEDKVPEDKVPEDNENI
jgi:hypothetical protein